MFLFFFLTEEPKLAQQTASFLCQALQYFHKNEIRRFSFNSMVFFFFSVLRVVNFFLQQNRKTVFKLVSAIQSLIYFNNSQQYRDLLDFMFIKKIYH